MKLNANLVYKLLNLFWLYILACSRLIKGESKGINLLMVVLASKGLVILETMPISKE
jgi:hypothetical protein